MRSPRLTSPTSSLLVIAIVAAGCAGPVASPGAPSGSAAARSESASPRASRGASGAAPSVAPGGVVPGALLVVGRSGDPDLEVIESPAGKRALGMQAGVPDASWGHMFVAHPVGNVTRVQNVAFGDSTGPQIVLDGTWSLPRVGLEPVQSGRSLDDSTVVLVGEPSVGVSRFAVVRASGPEHEGPLELVRTIELKGAFDFDAISPDGSILYVIEQLSNATGAYQVRSLPVATGRLDEAVITDKRNIGEAMAGAPVTQLRRADGTVMTLYLGAEHPFVHALNTPDKWAVCIDLPANGSLDAEAGKDWGLTQTPNGRAVFAVNATLGLVVEIDPNELIARRTTRLATASAGPAIVLAKFGHEPVGPLGRRVVVTQTGNTIVAGGRDGLVGIASGNLSVVWRALDGQPVRAVALTGDGLAAFALLASGRIVAVSTVDGSSLGTVPGDGYDRLVAITG